MPAEPALRAPAPAARRPGSVVAVRTARLALRSGVLWGWVFGLTVASSALGYVSAYKTPAARANFATTFGSNAGLDAIAGPANQLQTVAGYTVWKSLAFLSVLGALWGLLTATRLLRGEEDAGRWELLLAGQTTKRRATAQVIAGLGAGFAALFALTCVISVAVGHASKVHIATGSMAFFAIAVVSSAAIFLAAGALASQVAATRRQAAGYAGAALGVSYALRMVADSGTGLAWLRWATPLGWIEELQPLTSPRPLALVPIGALTALLAVIAVHLAGSRDLGASILADRGIARPRTRLLSGPLGLTVRLARATVLAWTGAIAATALLLGFVAKQAGQSFATTPSIEKVLTKLGAHGRGADAYLGVAFLIVAVLVAFVAIGQITAARGEEAAGHLEHFLVRPVARWTWLADRLSVSVTAIVASGLTAGLFTWLGAASEHAGVSFVGVLEAGLNLVPPALCILGIGVLTIGVWPRGTSIVTYAVLAWSFLIELVGGLVSSNHWLLDTSLFHQMAPAPAVSPDWTSGAVLVVLGAAAALIGGSALQYRDLAGE